MRAPPKIEGSECRTILVGALYTFAVTAEEIVHEYFMTRFAEVRDDDDIERQLFGDYEAPQPR